MSSFIPLTAPVPHTGPLTFVFRGNELLLGAADSRLADQAVCDALEVDETLLQPLGLFADIYYRAVCVPADTPAPTGFEFVKLRGLRDTHVDRCGRALLQMPELRPEHLSAHIAGHDGIDHAR